MKKHQYVSEYSADTFEFELKSILGSRLDGCSFNGEVGKGTFKIWGNYFYGARGFLRCRPVLEGRFYEEKGVTRVDVTHKYGAAERVVLGLFALLFFFLGVWVFIAAFEDGVLSSLGGLLCVLGWGLVLAAVAHVNHLILARFYLRKFKRIKALKLS